MNLFEYLDRRNRRKVILGQLKYWRKENYWTAKTINDIPERLMEVYLNGSMEEKNQIKYYTDKLNELL